MQAIINLYETYTEALHAIQELEAVADIPVERISLVALTTKDNAAGFYLEEGDIRSLKVLNKAPEVKGSFFSQLDTLPFDDIGIVITAGWLVDSARKAVPEAGHTYGTTEMRNFLIETMIESGLDRKHAETYAEGIRHGGTLVGIQTAPEQAGMVMTIMQKDHKPLEPHMHGSLFLKGGWNQEAQDRTVKVNLSQSRLIVIPVR